RTRLEAAARTPQPTAFAGATDCPDLAAAVTAGFRWAQPDGIVLLSPAAPSFGVYKDYRDRAEAFAREVRALSLSSEDRGSKLPSERGFWPAMIRVATKPAVFCPR